MVVPSGQDTQRPQRGQSSPLGLLLVFAIVITATTVLVAVGTGAITGTQNELDTERVENTMTQMDSQAALVALGSSDRQQIDMSADGSATYQVDDSAGEMTLSYQDQTTGTTTTIFSEELGAVTYENSGGSQIAYQGGGVWRSDGDGSSVMISPPEFHYRDATLTLPLVTVGNSNAFQGRAAISRTSTTQQFPTGATGFSNPLENARVQITVTSEYYRAWGQYFETRTQGEVEYDDANNRVTLDLVTPLQNTRITSATSSLSASGSFYIGGSAKVDCGDSVYTNSYNSSEPGDYCAQTPGTGGDNGDIVYGNDIDIDQGSGGSNIRGDVVSGASVEVAKNGNGPPYVYGNISHASGTCSDCGGRIKKGNADVEQISGVDEAPAINGIVRTRVNNVEDDNDNSGAPISGGTIDDSATLTSGNYYVDYINVDSGDRIELDTTGGDITIAVEEDITVQDNAEIDVVGDGTVNVYVQGAGTTTELYMDDGTEITNDGDDAPQFRMFGPSNFTAELDGGGSDLARYVGVIYAPPGNGGTGSVTLNGGNIYGGVLTGTTTIANGNGGSIHYDEALRDEQVLQRGDSVVRVTYIHASTNEIVVESG